MKEKLKIVLIIIGLIFSIIIVDSGYALLFDHSPMIKIQTRGMVDHGIFVDTYHCGNGKNDTVIKGFSYSCSYDGDYIIVDTSTEIKNFTCAEALEQIYEDGEYIYYLNCLKSKYIEVRYDNNEVENIREALNNRHIEIGDLDKFKITYIKYKK